MALLLVTSMCRLFFIALNRKELPTYLPTSVLPSVKKRKSLLNVSASKLNDVRSTRGLIMICCHSLFLLPCCLFVLTRVSRMTCK